MSQSCTECQNLAPDYAEFCPQCGHALGPNQPQTLIGLPAVSNPAAQRRTLEIEPDVRIAVPEFNPLHFDFQDDEELTGFEPPKRPLSAYLALALSAVLLFGALVGGGLVIHESTTPEPEAVEAPATTTAVLEQAETAVEEPEIDPEAIAIREEADPKPHKVIKYEAQPLVPVLTHRGSRYDSVDKRAESVQLRLKHVAMLQQADKEDSRFGAKRAGNVYEVVFTRTNGAAFRIVDISKHDVRAWEKLHGDSSKAILANLVADQLNQTFKSPSGVPQS